MRSHDFLNFNNKQMTTSNNAIINIIDSDSELSLEFEVSDQSLRVEVPALPSVPEAPSSTDRQAEADDIQLQALKELASNQFGISRNISRLMNNASNEDAGSLDSKLMLQDVAGVVERDQLSSYIGKDMTGKPVTPKSTTALDQHTLCAICEKPLPKPIETQTLLIKGIKPRFLREIKKIYPLKTFHQHDRICIKDVHSVMQSRIEQLLETDQSEFARLQDDAMKNLGTFELEEQNWQKQFEQGWTMGEKAADLVARFGGSWKFIGVLLSLLALWAFVNILLSQPWSIVPPMLAGLQAPIIMMSQNRQGQLDRLQSDYISKIVLRAEHQVRHVNAKIDHLLSHQWKRLLEIQEIQIDLLQTLQSQNRRMTTSPHSKQMYWCMETQPDEHILLQQLDDVFAGEGTVTLRNDLDVKYMSLLGRIIRVEIQPKDKPPVSFANGDLPSRYKSTFFLKRGDKITDFWKTPISRVNLTYTPPYQAAILQLKQGQSVTKLRVDFFPTTTGGIGKTGPIQLAMGVGTTSENSNPLSYLHDVIGNRPLPEENWKTVAHAIWPTNSIPSMNSNSTYVGYAATPNAIPSISAMTSPDHTPFVQSGGTGAGGDLSVLLGTGTGKDVILAEALPVTVYLDEGFCGPNIFVFLCDETRVAFHATIKEAD
ncbi:hypothetical protein BDR26DRAFT_859808 [Obelidium mucronatum]|nr:hypothetical protein BDR26DRAFT_859808 [Obelidium mucronatum]